MVDFGMSVIFGNGSISKRLQELITDYRVIDSKTSKEVIHQYLHSNNLTNVIAQFHYRNILKKCLIHYSMILIIVDSYLSVRS